MALSRERARHNSRLLDRLSLAWENAVRPMLLQVTGGLVGSVALLGGTALLLGVAAAPQQVLANDEPLGALTAPHYLYSTASPGAIVTGHDTTIIVEASVDSRGRVYDYTIVSGPQDDAIRTQVANQLAGQRLPARQRLRRPGAWPRRGHLLRHLRPRLVGGVDRGRVAIISPFIRFFFIPPPPPTPPPAKVAGFL